MALRLKELIRDYDNAEARRKIIELFGNIEVFPVDHALDSLHFTLHQTLPNFYRCSGATVGKAPLYVLVPYVPVGGIWPDDVRSYDGIRFGVALSGGEPITPAVVFHKGDVGLYICTDPNAIGYQLQVGSLGI